MPTKRSCRFPNKHPDTEPGVPCLLRQASICSFRLPITSATAAGDRWGFETPCSEPPDNSAHWQQDSGEIPNSNSSKQYICKSPQRYPISSPPQPDELQPAVSQENLPGYEMDLAPSPTAVCSLALAARCR